MKKIYLLMIYARVHVNNAIYSSTENAKDKQLFEMIKKKICNQ